MWSHLLVRDVCTAFPALCSSKPSHRSHGIVINKESNDAKDDYHHLPLKGVVQHNWATSTTLSSSSQTHTSIGSVARCQLRLDGSRTPASISTLTLWIHWRRYLTRATALVALSQRSWGVFAKQVTSTFTFILRAANLGDDPNTDWQIKANHATYIWDLLTSLAHCRPSSIS